MSISDHGPVRALHTPESPEETVMLDADADLSRLMQEALDNKDFDTLVYAIAEKRSIERALGESRWETFNHRMDREFFGGDS